MKEFFREWRRKVGVVTLVMACYLAFQWAASFGHEHTAPSVLPAREWPEFNNGRIEYWPTTIRWKTRDPLTNGEFVFTQDHLAWSIPFWSITVPLTLISFWLLVSKPHKSNQKKNGEPITEKVE